MMSEAQMIRLKLMEFASQVDKMRIAQRGYFSEEYGTYRKNQYLHESKIMEKHIDELLNQILRPKPETGSLF